MLHTEHVRKEYLHGREAFLLYPMVLPSSPEKFWAEKIRKKIGKASMISLRNYCMNSEKLGMITVAFCVLRRWLQQKFGFK